MRPTLIAWTFSTGAWWLRPVDFAAATGALGLADRPARGTLEAAPAALLYQAEHLARLTLQLPAALLLGCPPGGLS